MDEMNLTFMPCTHARPDTLAYWPQAFSIDDSMDKEWVRFWKLQHLEERRASEGKTVAVAEADHNTLGEVEADSMDIDSTHTYSKESTRKRNVTHIDTWNVHGKRQRMNCEII